jgi:hypothetical protein
VQSHSFGVSLRGAIQVMRSHSFLIASSKAMVAVIVGVGLAFFRHRFAERLIANIGVVLLFTAFYLRFFGRS